MRFEKLTEKSKKMYADNIIELADTGLSRGYLPKEEYDKLTDDNHFCNIVVCDTEKTNPISFNYGRKVDRLVAMEELRCDENELRLLFPNEEKFVIDDGCVCAPEFRGKGISHRLFAFGKDELFDMSNIILFFVWNRHGGERRAVNFIHSFGGKFLKTVPRYWENMEGLECSICGSPCVCDCDIYYLRKEDYKDEYKY